MATPFMNLTIPTVGVTVGPTWASQINTVLNSIDAHNHTSGNGALIPTAALNINADLSFGSFNQTGVKSTRFTSQSLALSTASDKECLYSVNGSLYYNNSSGTAVQITSGSGLNLASVGSIGGDYGGGGVTASVTYNNTTKAYSFLQASSSTAKMAMGDILLYETATATNAVTLKSPTSLASAYSITLPAALQAYTGFVRMTSAGVVQNDVQPDNSTVEVSSSSLRIKDSGVTAAKIAADAVTTVKILNSNVTTAKIADGAITQAKREALNIQSVGPLNQSSLTSTSWADVSGASVSITTTGRPVMIVFPTGGVTGSASASNLDIGWRIVRDGSAILTTAFKFSQTTTNSYFYTPGGMLNTLDDTASAGAHIYKLQYIKTTGTQAEVVDLRMKAFEL